MLNLRKNQYPTVTVMKTAVNRKTAVVCQREINHQIWRTQDIAKSLQRQTNCPSKIHEDNRPTPIKRCINYKKYNSCLECLIYVPDNGFYRCQNI